MGQHLSNSHLLMIHLRAINASVAGLEGPSHSAFCFASRHEIYSQMYLRYQKSITGLQRASQTSASHRFISLDSARSPERRVEILVYSNDAMQNAGSGLRVDGEWETSWNPCHQSMQEFRCALCLWLTILDVKQLLVEIQKYRCTLIVLGLLADG